MDIIEPNNLLINRFKTVNDYNNDFCFAFLRKKTYTCTNGVIYHLESSSNYCEVLKGNEDNYKKLITFSIYSDKNFKNYISDFNRFYSKVNGIVSKYTLLINDLSQKLYSFEEASIQTTKATNYLQELKTFINGNILINYYGEKIILEAYDYYKKDSEQRLNNIFEEAVTEWENYFSNVYQIVNNNLNNYKNSVNEFGQLSIIYYTYLYQKIFNEYYDLVMSHEQREFNNTISFYYSHLIKIINSQKQFILYNLPTNNIGFEKVLEQRKKEINQLFDELINNILDSKNKDLSISNQTFLLQVQQTDFFNISSVLINYLGQLKNACEGKAYKIYGLSNAKANDLYSYIARLYLENSVNGKQINDFYKVVDNQNFINLEHEKFEELVTKNWFFNKYQFVKLLNDTFNENNAQINSEFTTKKESYKEILENELLKYEYFTKKNMTLKISDLYSNTIKEFKEDDIITIKNDVSDIIDKFIFYLKKEEDRLKDTTILYNDDISEIEKTINDYKYKIFSYLNDTINDLVYRQMNYLEAEVFKNYYEKYLKDYLDNIEQETKLYENIELLNSTIKNALMIFQNNDTYKKSVDEAYEYFVNFDQTIATASNVMNTKMLDLKDYFLSLQFNLMFFTWGYVLFFALTIFFYIMYICKESNFLWYIIILHILNKEIIHKNNTKRKYKNIKVSICLDHHIFFHLLLYIHLFHIQKKKNL